MVLMKERRAWALERKIIGQAGLFCIRLESKAMGWGARIKEGSRSLHTAHTKAPPCTSEQPTVPKCDQHNVCVGHKCVRVCLFACVFFFWCFLTNDAQKILDGASGFYQKCKLTRLLDPLKFFVHLKHTLYMGHA